MEYAMKRIVELGKVLAKHKDYVRVRGSLDLIAILREYPAFVAGVESFARDRRGRKAKNPAPIEVEYLVHLIERLYERRGIPPCFKTRKTLKTVLTNAALGADFFDPIKGKHWIDLLSALEAEHALFSQGSDKFSVFFENYVEFMGKTNTKKPVPFYGRWSKDIAALYTVYLGETFVEYEALCDEMNAVIEEGRRRVRFPSCNTMDITQRVVNEILEECGRNKREAVTQLCAYMAEAPRDFAYE